MLPIETAASSMPPDMLSVTRPPRVARFGAWWSLLCALHCACVPLVFALAPTLKLALHSVHHPQHTFATGLLWTLVYERELLVIGIVLSGIGLVSHGLPPRRSLAMFALGSVTLLGTAWLGAPGFGWHVALNLSGALLLLMASAAHFRKHDCQPAVCAGNSTRIRQV